MARDGVLIVGPCNFIVKDLRSVNGVYVNGKAIKDEQELVPGTPMGPLRCVVGPL